MKFDICLFFRQYIEKIPSVIKICQEYFSRRPKFISDNISLLEWEMFRTKFVKKLETRSVCSNFFRKSWQWGNVETYGSARQATYDNAIRRVCFARWITKAANTNLEYVMLMALPRQKLLRERSSIFLRYTSISYLVPDTSAVLCIENWWWPPEELCSCLVHT